MKTLSKQVILEKNHVAMVVQERNLLARLHCPQVSARTRTHPHRTVSRRGATTPRGPPHPLSGVSL